MSYENQVLLNLLSDKNITGIILVPIDFNAKRYKKIISRNIPFICLEKKINDDNVSAVVSDYKEAMYKATKHLIENGHEKIGLILKKDKDERNNEKIEGYKNSLIENNLEYKEELIFKIDTNNEEKEIEEEIKKIHKLFKITSFISGTDDLTLLLLKSLKNLGLEWPEDISVVGFGYDEWSELITSSITTLERNAEEISKVLINKMMSKIQSNNKKESETELVKIPIEFHIRKSTQTIGKGPFGEKSFSSSELKLSKNEILILKEKNYKVCISFHYGGTSWRKLHEKGIRDTLDKYGVSVLSVTEAHFDPELQVTQLEGLRMQKPDVIIAIPSDDKITAEKFKEISKETKLIFISNVPIGYETDDYYSCISVNERENGINAGNLIGEYFKKEKNVNIGFINHGAQFYGTNLRDKIAEQTIRENYPNIKIVSKKSFYKIDDAYSICKKMFKENPEIKGLYVSWDTPALKVIECLKKIGRTDVNIITFDLDLEIAKYLAKENMVKGLSTQQPYEQGIAVGLATVKALLGEKKYKYIGVPSLTVKKNNLVKMWEKINHEKLPDEIIKLMD